LATNDLLFFHNLWDHWVTSHFRDGNVFHYDSLYTEIIHTELKKQLIAFYGSAIVKIPWLVKQNRDKGCACFAV
uniref:Ubiquitin-like protease family profile domain-containing protein n=1 Tax=Amphimedon queenslandica TaxID=400682 RepID=A0A1X7TZU0_AMPQE